MFKSIKNFFSSTSEYNALAANPMRRRRHMSVESRQARMGYVFCLPLILGLAILFIPNIVKTVLYSLNETVITGDGYYLVWQGLENYHRALFVNADFPQLLVSSYGEMILQVPVIVIFSLFFASVLNQKFHGRVVARAIFFLPVILATGIVLKVDAEFDLTSIMPSRSTLNDAVGTAASGGMFGLEGLLTSLNFSESLIKFVSSAANGVYDIVNNSGMQIFILLAAFQEIPNSLYEAAQVEGCSKWETFWKITIPMVSRQIVVVTVYTIIDSFTKNNSALFSYISDKAWGSGSAYSLAMSMYLIYIVSLALILGLAAFIIVKFVQRSNRA